MIAKKYEEPREPMPFRDSAGSFEFKEGTGHITAMCSMGEFMEIYKIDATAQVRSPESIDPDRTNPYAPWASTVHLRAGSGNPIVARLVVQTSEMLKVVTLPTTLDNDTLLLHMHQIKETLLPCEVISKRISAAVADIVDQIKNNRTPRDNHGRGYNPFPHVPDLVVDANNFLIHVNKIVRLITQMPRMFTALKEDSNFDHLAATLTAALPPGTKLTDWVSTQAPIVRRIVELRNFTEHPKPNKKTEISDFKIMPNGQIRVPYWGFEENDFTPIDEEMQNIVDYLMHLAEGMLLSCLEQFQVRNFPLIVVRNAQPTPECPVLYSYTVDMSQLKFPDDPPASTVPAPPQAGRD
jgi:hypothetical protein